MGSVEQKPGLRLAMGLGIIFCMTEVRMLTDVQSQIEQGFQPDAKIAKLLQLFPKSWCTFEQIILLRTFYFYLFNCICSWSILFIEDEMALKVQYSDDVVNSQIDIKHAIFALYKLYV